MKNYKSIDYELMPKKDRRDKPKRGPIIIDPNNPDYIPSIPTIPIPIIHPPKYDPRHRRDRTPNTPGVPYKKPNNYPGIYA